MNDLRASRDLLCGIRIETATRFYKVTGVKDVDEDDEWITIYTPQTAGDDTTTTTLLTADIVSVMLRQDLSYDMGDQTLIEGANQ